MKNQVAEAVKFCFAGNVIAQLSTLVDETEPGVEKALRQSVPLVLNTLASRVGQGLTPQALLSRVREADAAAVLTQLTERPDAALHERSSNLLLDLLGDTYRSTVNQIAVGAGIRPKASGTLLQVAATAVLGVLGKLAVEHDFSPTDFVYWLHAQKDAIGAAMLPPVAGGSRKETPGHYLARQPAAPLPPAPMPEDWPEPDAAPAAPRASSHAVQGWQWGVMLLVAVCLGYFFGRGLFGAGGTPAAQSPATVAPPNGPQATTAPVSEAVSEPAAAAFSPEATPRTSAGPQPATSRAPAASALASTAATRLATARAATPNEPGGRYDQDRDTYIYDTGRPIVLTLADGTTQKVGANSTENRLYTFLASPSVQVDSVNRTKGWINFDRINFEAGRASLTPESALQLGNIASILNTFPKAVVKIGGYTDSTGDAVNNFRLSEDRARAAMLTLASMGVSPDRLQSKGYGPRYFVRPNSTATGRALNRRVSIRVVSK